MGIIFKIALRSLFSKRSRYAHSAIGWVAMIGLILGISAQVVAVSILSGFEKHFTDSILGFNADLVLMRDGEIGDPQEVLQKLKSYQEPNGVQHITPFLYREGLIAHRSKVKGLVIKGVDSSSFSSVYDLKIKPFDSLKSSDLSTLFNQSESELTPVLLGEDLAEYLGVSPEDNIISVLSPKGDLKKISDPKQFKKFQVIGTFASGLYEYDSQFVLLDLGKAQEFFEVPKIVTGFEMKVKNLNIASQIAESMAKDFGFPYQALSWDELNAEIFQALKLEKKLFFIIMGLIVIVAAANLIGLIVILISEQSKEISILKAMGMKNKSLQRIFTLQGLLLAFVGIFLGTVLGMGAAYFMSKHSIVNLAKEVYLVSTLPVVVSWKMTVWVAGFGFISSYLAVKLASRRIISQELDL